MLKCNFLSKTIISDMDPHVSLLILIGWIRIQIQEDKNDKKIEKREEISSFEVLDVLFES
jgi:hypothetical protein